MEKAQMVEAEAAERNAKERAEIAATIELAEAQLEANYVDPGEPAVTAVAMETPGEDRTLWLPDELLMLILVQVLFVVPCSGVCRRWRRLCQERSVTEASWASLWVKYAEGKRQPRRVVDRFNEFQSICDNRNGVVFCGTMSGIIQMRSEKDGSLLRLLYGHEDRVTALAVAPDGVLFSASFDLTVRMWTETGEHLQTLEGHRQIVVALAVGKSYAFSGSSDEAICVWHRSTGECVKKIYGSGGPIAALALDNRDQLYSSDQDEVIWVRSATDFTLLRVLKGHTGIIFALAFDTAGNVFSGGADGTIRVWCGTTGAQLRVLNGHSTCIVSLTVAPDGTLFSLDSHAPNNFRVWRPGGERSFKVTLPLPGHSRAVFCTSRARLWVGGEVLCVYGH